MAGGVVRAERARRRTLSRRRVLTEALPGALGLLVLPGALGTGRPAAAAPRPAPVPAARAQGTDTLKITQERLDNGLGMILVEDRSTPTVAVDVWYIVGAANDPTGRSGFAHLFEHMMFQGSANVPPGRHGELISGAGGNSNASTALDWTNYFEVLPAHQLPLALWLEADRLRSLVVNEPNFVREREVVKEEYRQRVDNQPYGEASLRLQTIAFDYPPYERPVIGSIEDLDRATVEEVRAFHAAYYKPNNAVLVVAGDLDVGQTRDLIRRYFADIPRQDPPPALLPYAFTPGRQAREETIQDNLARVPATFIAYRLPPRGEPDNYAAELLSRVLGAGGSSRLAGALLDTGLATAANTFLSGNRGPSLLGVSLVPNASVAPERLEQVYDDELNRVRSQGVDPAELEKAVNQIRTQRIRGLQSVLGLAESVQAANFYLGDPRGVFAELDRYRAVTSADIQRVANAYLGPESRNVIRVVPAGGGAR